MSAPPGKKLRTACDICHQAKMKCSGGTPCTGCQESGSQCYYSFSQRLGRPRGTKNKRTHDTMTNNAIGNGMPITGEDTQHLPGFNFDPTLNGSGSKAVSGFESLLMDPDAQDMSYSFINSNAFWESIGMGGDDQEDILMSAGTQPLAPAHTKDSSDVSATSSMELEGSAYISPPQTHSSSGPSYTGRASDGTEQRLSDTSTLSPIQPSSCDCFTTHVELLFRLRELEKNSGTPLTIESVLTGAQQALAPWRNLIQCPICQQDDDQGVLLLSAMSIRSILQRLQRLCAENRYRYENGGSTLDTLRIGKYQTTGEEQTLVMDVLILHTLGKIKCALMALKEKLERTRKRGNAEEGLDSPVNEVLGGPATYDRGCMHAMLRSLDNTVQVVEKAVRNMIKPDR